MQPMHMMQYKLKMLMILSYNIFIAFGCTSLVVVVVVVVVVGVVVVVVVVVVMVVDATQCNVTQHQVGERLGVNEMRGPSGVNEMR